MNSRILIYNFAIILLVCTNLNAQDFSVNQINQHIQSITSQKLHEINSELDAQNFAESADFTQLEAMMRDHWPEILANFELVEGGNDGKIIIVAAFQALDAPDYMSALETLASKLSQGQIEKIVMLAAIFPSGRMQAFLADNYQHQRVQAFLADLKPRFAGDAETQAAITSLEDGTAKTEIDHFREGHQNLPEGDIPVVMLQP